eukprot:tig00020912_g15837.t1
MSSASMSAAVRAVVSQQPAMRLSLSQQALIKHSALPRELSARGALPCAYASRLGSGVSAETGLLTAVIGGAVASVFGATPLAISGPAAALSFLCFDVVQRFGVDGLVVLTGACGLLQVLFGALRLGGLARFVPAPVIAGFTSGIGVMVVAQQVRPRPAIIKGLDENEARVDSGRSNSNSQLPKMLGISPAPSSRIVDVAPHVLQHLGEVNPHALGLALATVGLSVLLPRVPYLNRVPATLFAVAGLTALSALVLPLDVGVVGAIPASLPPARLPDLSALSAASLAELAGCGAVLFGVASCEALLACSAVDKLAKGRVLRHCPDQELVGQGLANAASAAFGGIPVSAVVVRSSLHVAAGAMTRRAPLLHALIVARPSPALAPALLRI